MERIGISVENAVFVHVVIGRQINLEFNAWPFIAHLCKNVLEFLSLAF